MRCCTVVYELVGNSVVAVDILVEVATYVVAVAVWAAVENVVLVVTVVVVGFACVVLRLPYFVRLCSCCSFVLGGYSNFV